jgi:hypothetical protein
MTLTDTQQKEFNDFVAVHLKDKAKSNLAVYKSRYKVFAKHFKHPISNIRDDILLQILLEATEHNEFPSNTRGGLVSFLILLKKHYGHSHKDLLLFQIENTIQIQIQTQERKKSQQQELGNYRIADLKDLMMRIYSKKNYTGYIVNYLLINYGVRNLDLNVKIITDKNELNDEENFLFYKNKSTIQYIRNDYKTHKTYGQKIYDIKDTRFITAVRKLVEKNVTYLLHTADGRKLDETSLSRRIGTYTLDGLGEADIFKIIVSEYDKDYDTLEKYSKSRGTDIKTIIGSYAINK